MKIATINFSGNVGKSTLSKHLIYPRLKDPEYIAVESINADETDEAAAIRGKQFGALQERLLVIDDAVIDIGSSNVEDFIGLMAQYSGSHEDIDIFAVPAVAEAKQIRDTIATIEGLAALGVDASKIRVVFNKLQPADKVEEAFYPIFAYHGDHKNFTLRPALTIQYSELYQRLRSHNVTIGELLTDKTDYRAKLKAAKTDEEKAEAVARISMGRLAASARENLDHVFAALVA